MSCALGPSLDFVQETTYESSQYKQQLQLVLSIGFHARGCKVHGRHKVSGLKGRAHTVLLGQMYLTLSKIGMLWHRTRKRMLINCGP